MSDTPKAYEITVTIKVVGTDGSSFRFVRGCKHEVTAEAIFEPLSDFKTHALNDQIRGVAGNACGVALDKLRKELEDEPS